MIPTKSNAAREPHRFSAQSRLDVRCYRVALNPLQVIDRRGKIDVIMSTNNVYCDRNHIPRWEPPASQLVCSRCLYYAEEFYSYVRLLIMSLWIAIASVISTLMY